MSKQLILRFDTGDREFCQVLHRVIAGHQKDILTKVLAGNFTGARKLNLQIDQILCGMNPVRPFVREFVKPCSSGGGISTEEAHCFYERRVRQGVEREIKKNIFSASFRRAIDEEFQISPSGVNGKVFEGVTLDVR